MNINKLIISSGGTNGYIYVGILKYLQENNYLNKIKKYIGCSVGSIICFLLSINYSINEIEEIFINLDVSKLLNDFNINLLIKYKCIYNNYKVVKYFKELITNKGLNENITLKEHYNIYNKKICFIVSNITSNKCEYISYKNYPDLKLWKAVLMSISIPIMFPSVKYKNLSYVDGGLYDQIGIYKIKSKDVINNNIIVITFINKNGDNNLYDNNNNKILELVNYVSNCTYVYINESINNNKFILLKDYKYFYCYVNNVMTNNVKNLFLDIIINNEQKIEMINNGYNYAIIKNLNS